MAKPELTESLEQLKARAERSGDVTFLEIDTDDSNPVITAGFDDEDVVKMDGDALRKNLADINMQEKQLEQMLEDCKRRRRDVNAILKRRTEIMRNGLYHRPR